MVSCPEFGWQDPCGRSLGQDLHVGFLARSLRKLARRGRKAQGQTTRPSVHERTQETNTATPVSCEPAQSKCTWTCHKNHFVRKLTREMPDASSAASVLREPAQSKCTWTCHKSRFAWKFTGHRFFEPTQSKCTWTFHKSHFAQKFTGKMPYASAATPVLRKPTQSKCTWTCHKSYFVWKFTGTWPDTDGTTSIERPALTVTARTPQCGHTVWGRERERERKKEEICKAHV